MRLASVGLLIFLTSCADPYDLAVREKLTHANGCNVPFNSPAATHVPDLTLCEWTPLGPAGFVVVRGTGAHSAYGDVNDAFAPNALTEPNSDCPSSHFTDSRAFWAEVHAQLRTRNIVTNGSGTNRGCAETSPALLSIRLVDWADVDATRALVETAMRTHDICSTVAIEVVGVACVQSVTAMPDGG
jgi:hypothetical protein